MKGKILLLAMAVWLSVVLAGVCGTNDLYVDNLTVTSNITQTAPGGTVSFKGKVGINKTTPAEALHVQGNVKIAGAGNHLELYGGNIKLNWNWLTGDDDDMDGIYVANSGNIIMMSAKGQDRAYVTLRRGGTVQDGNWIGVLNFEGRDGSVNCRAAQIVAAADGETGSNDMPGQIFLRTTPDGTDVPVTRITVKNDGKTGIGTASPSALLHVAGTSEFDGEATFDQGITYIPELGDLSMGVYTNTP